MNSPGFLHVSGNISLLNWTKLLTFTSCLSSSKNLLVLAADNLNFRKEVQMKYPSLVQGNDVSLEF